MKDFIVFYTDYQMVANNKRCNAFDYFEYGKKYEVIEIYETKKWDQYNIKVSLGGSKTLIIYYDYDGKCFYDTYEIQDGILVEYSFFPLYDYIMVDIQEERNKLIDKILDESSTDIESLWC